MKKKLKRIIISFILIATIFTIVANRSIENATNNLTYFDTDKIPYNKVGLLLGTAKYLHGGQTNLYYTYRINAAIKLFKAGKIDYILVSGDNSQENYDEPTTMKNDLIAGGVPESKIFLDYAGFRTLDSVVRCKYIFSQDSITIISQRFHNERAVYIAKRKDIEAIGFNAKDVDAYYGFKTKAREKLARVKMFLDLMLNKKPKFYGEKIEIK